MSQTNDLEFEESEPRRDLHIDSEQYEKFTELQESRESPFYEVENHDLFMFTVGYGRRHSSPQQAQSDEHAFFGRSQLSEAQETVLEAVAVHEEGTVEVLRDQRHVYQLAECLANGGVEALYERVFESDDDPLSELTLEVKQAYESVLDSE